MEKFEWFLSSTDNRLFGLPCCKHRVTKELCIFGPMGEIYQHDENTAQVILWGKNRILSHKIAAKYGRKVLGFTKGDEISFKVPKSRVAEVFSDLRCPPKQGFGLRYAKRYYGYSATNRPEK